MSAIEVIPISKTEHDKLLAMQEGHFLDFKAREIKPNKLSQSISAFANAEGGELYIGIAEDRKAKTFSWQGFASMEDANGHVQAFEQLFPLGSDYQYDFLSCDGFRGFVLKVQVAKTLGVVSASNGTVYIRRGAQNLPVEGNRLEILKRDKGITSFETESVNCDSSIVTNSEQVIKFMLEVVPTSEPDTWLEKQQLLSNGKPTVAAVVLFADEPQAILPKRCGIKVYRYQTSEEEGTRETLVFDPASIEGSAYEQIKNAVLRTQKEIESVKVRTHKGIESAKYPPEALHEVITNAVLHRDYSIADDIHIQIYDNRVEVKSPGTLPGHVTVQNILKERFARNSAIVRLINKFPDPPNKDVGEGLNTAFQAMKDMKLKDPLIAQDGGYVVVTLRHEPLASPEELILEYLKNHDEIANRQAREICYIGSENKMKVILQRMVKNGLVERVPERTRYNAAYQLPTTTDNESDDAGVESGPSLFDATSEN